MAQGLKIRGAIGDLQKRRAAERESRLEAKPRILDPLDVRGEYDLKRMLETTIGGLGLRPLTLGDIRALRANVRRVGDRFKKGATIPMLVDLSTPGDRLRANEQIRLATPVRMRGDVALFATNAGPDSRHTRHMVEVQFLDLGNAVASPKLSRDLTAKVTSGRVAVGCSCETWRYRLRFLATVAGYNFGRPETGATKITNPDMRGALCKHLLRVCVQAQAGAYKALIVRAIDEQRSTLKTNATITVSQREAAAFEAKGARQVKTTDERRAARKPSDATRERIAQSAATRAAQQKRRTAAAAFAAVERNIGLLVGSGALTKAKADEMLRALKETP